jgi:hypothetical protein
MFNKGRGRAISGKCASVSDRPSKFEVFRVGFIAAGWSVPVVYLGYQLLHALFVGAILNVKWGRGNTTPSRTVIYRQEPDAFLNEVISTGALFLFFAVGLAVLVWKLRSLWLARNAA